MRAPWRKTFDPDREFTVRRKFSCGGEPFAPGEAFDKTLVTVRRLRQLYDQRVIYFKGDTPGAKIVRRKRPSVDDDVIGPTTHPNDGVDIPHDWEGRSWNERRALAMQLSPGKIANGPDAAEAITAELARRGDA